MDGLWARGERRKHPIPNTKLQRNPGIKTPKTKLQTPKKSQVPSSKPRPAFRAWNLELGASLVFGVWCFDSGISLELGFWDLVFRHSFFPIFNSRCKSRSCFSVTGPGESV